MYMYNAVSTAAAYKNCIGSIASTCSKIALTSRTVLVVLLQHVPKQHSLLELYCQYCFNMFQNSTRYQNCIASIASTCSKIALTTTTVLVVLLQHVPNQHSLLQLYWQYCFNMFQNSTHYQNCIGSIVSTCSKIALTTRTLLVVLSQHVPKYHSLLELYWQYCFYIFQNSTHYQNCIASIASTCSKIALTTRTVLLVLPQHVPKQHPLLDL